MVQANTHPHAVMPTFKSYCAVKSFAFACSLCQPYLMYIE